MKSLFFYNCILITILIQSFLTEYLAELTFVKIYQEIYVQIDVPIPENSSIPNYLHFWTEPLHNQSQDLQQMIYSPNYTNSSMNNSEIYLFQKYKFNSISP